MTNSIAAEKTAENVSQALKAADRSLHWLSEETFIPYPTLRRKIKDGGRNLSLVDLFQISGALGVSPHDLLADPKDAT